MKKFEGMVFDSDVKNDHINFDDKIDINIKHVREKTDTDETFRIIMKGMSVDCSVVNTLRRTILMHVLVYAFERKNVFIENEKCIYMYNNDLIYNQIETLPIFDIPNNFDLEDVEELKNGTDKNKKLVNIEIFLNVKNVLDTPRYITTHDIVMKVNDKVSTGYQKHPSLSIIVLKPQEEIHLRAIANLNDSTVHAAYEATTFAYHHEISSMEYMLIYDTLGQLDKDVIFTKACSILIKKLGALQTYVEELEKTNPPDPTSKIGEYELFGENDTLGNLLATILQKCDYTEIAGYVTPHLFVDHVIIKFKLGKKVTFTPTQVFITAILHAKKIFEHILKISKKS